MSVTTENLVNLFGLNEAKAAETLKNNKLCNTMAQVLREAEGVNNNKKKKKSLVLIVSSSSFVVLPASKGWMGSLPRFSSVEVGSL